MNSVSSFSLEFSKLKALVVDDAQTVLSVVRTMLRAMGFIDKNIDFAKDAKSAITFSKANCYDIIICDYNLGRGLNGKQILEEIRHYKLLGAGSIFIIISGESSSSIVRSIIELRPDEYILKPFSQKQFHRRVKLAYIRKCQYKRLYEAEYNNEPSSGLSYCEELIGRGNVDVMLVSRFKGVFLQALKKYSDAEQFYRDLYAKHREEWIEFELCNVLIELGSYDEVESIINTSLNSASHRELTLPELSVMSKLAIYQGEIPDAISHLELASALAPGNPTRELVIANLCVAAGDYVSAEKRYYVYKEYCRDTYRDDFTTSLHVVRAMLFSAEKNMVGELLDKQVAKIESLIFSLYSSANTFEQKFCVEVLHAYKHIMLNTYHEAMPLIYRCITTDVEVDFYTRYHICMICSKMMFDRIYNKNFHIAYKISLNEGELFESKSCMVMLRQLDKAHNENKKEYKEMYEHAMFYRNSSPQRELGLLIKLHKRAIYLQAVALRIIELLGFIWPSSFNKFEILNIIDSCDKTISSIMPLSERMSKNYSHKLRVAKGNIEERRA